MNPMVQTIINDAVELAKENAISILKNMNTEDIHKLVEAEMVSVINPLKQLLLIGLKLEIECMFCY